MERIINKIMVKKNKAINIKIDSETKSKLETLAHLKRQTLQDLLIDIITIAIDNNKEKINEVEKLRE